MGLLRDLRKNDFPISTYDLNGNMIAQAGLTYSYNYRNQMVSVSENGSTTRYKYDVLGRRIEKSASGTATKYFYSGNQVIEERDNADLVTKQLVFGNGIDEVLRLDNYNADGTAIENSYYFHTNGIGSTTAITDINGNIIERYSYGLYGIPTIKNALDQVIAESSIGNEYMFQGRRFEKESGLYYYRARHFDPVLGRFLSGDPLGYRDSMNLYQGMNMNPANFIDPMGTLYLNSSYNQFHNNNTIKIYPGAPGLFDIETALGFLPGYWVIPVIRDFLSKDGDWRESLQSGITEESVAGYLTKSGKKFGGLKGSASGTIVTSIYRFISIMKTMSEIDVPLAHRIEKGKSRNYVDTDKIITNTFSEVYNNLKLDTNINVTKVEKTFSSDLDHIAVYPRDPDTNHNDFPSMFFSPNDSNHSRSQVNMRLTYIRGRIREINRNRADKYFAGRSFSKWSKQETAFYNIMKTMLTGKEKAEIDKVLSRELEELKKGNRTNYYRWNR